MPAPRCARVERKESFPYGARLDRTTYWKLVLTGETIRKGDEYLLFAAGTWHKTVRVGERVIILNESHYRRRVTKGARK